MLERRPAVKIERVGAKVSGETSRYNEMNTESRVRGRPYSVQAPRGPQIACTGIGRFVIHLLTENNFKLFVDSR